MFKSSCEVGFSGTTSVPGCVRDTSNFLQGEGNKAIEEEPQADK